VLCLSLVRLLGFVGLALAMSLAAILNAAVLLYLLQVHLKQIEFKNLGSCLIRALGAALFMAIFVYVFLAFLDARPFRPIPLTGVWDKANFAMQVVYLGVALFLGVATFGIAGKLLGLQELERVQELLWKRLRIRKGQA